MLKVIRNTLLVVVTLIVLAAGCSAYVASTIDTSDAIPQTSAGIDPTLVPSLDYEVTDTPDATEVTTCDVAREMFLTGSKAEIHQALKDLKADSTADGSAREYAGYYLGRDSGDKDLQEMDQTLIVSICTTW